MCQQTPMRCCLDMISQTFTDPTAGLAGKTTDKGQVCTGGAESGGAPPSPGTLTDRCCCCWAQRSASLLHALNAFLLESQQGFYFPVGHSPAASAPALCPAPRCVDQHVDRAQAALLQRPLRAEATEVSPLSPWSPPQPQCPAGAPAAPGQPCPRSRAHTRVGGGGARLLMSNWHLHLSPAGSGEERGRAGARLVPGAAVGGPGSLRGLAVGPEPCGHTSPGRAGSAGSRLSPRPVLLAGSFLEPNGSYPPALLGL